MNKKFRRYFGKNQSVLIVKYYKKRHNTDLKHVGTIINRVSQNTIDLALYP